ncbi:MAG TPA: helix-turn-helix domain-containing protein [Pedobacter sp.]|jgi:AraC-like DNA-binding protein
MNILLKNPYFSLLNTDHIRLDQNWNYKNVVSTFYRLYLIDDGEGRLFDHQESFKLEKNYLYLIPSFTLCNYECNTFLSQYHLSFIEETHSGGSLFYNNRKVIKIEARSSDYEQFKRLLELNPNRGLHRSHNPRVYEKRPILQSFNELNNKLQPSANLETQGLILQLLSRFMHPENFRSSSVQKTPSKVLDAIEYMQTNLHKNLTVAELAKRANHNSDYFSRIFFESTGERPLQYLRNKRIERSQILLSTTEMTFSQIAEETGFENLPYFSKIFKQVTGSSPSYFRKNSQIT